LSIKIASIISIFIHIVALVIILKSGWRSVSLHPQYNSIIARLIIPKPKYEKNKIQNKKLRKTPLLSEKMNISKTKNINVSSNKKNFFNKKSNKVISKKSFGLKSLNNIVKSEPTKTSEIKNSINNHKLISLPANKPLGRNLIDKDIIEKIAKKSLEQKDIEKTGITFDTDELKYYSYMRRLKERIESIWIYPPDAAEKGIYGDLYIKFTIKKDGYLGTVELIRTSGYRELDEAALQALKDGEPYWPLPKNWDKEAITITGHFIYTLYGMYIR